MTTEEIKAKEGAVVKALGILREHFDAVQILTSFQDEGHTNRSFAGSGNFYARQGMAHEFIKDDEARGIAIKISEELGDGGEES